MAMVVVDDSCLQADSQPKSGGLVWGSTAAYSLCCIHQMNRVNSRNAAMTFSGHDDSTINIVLRLLLSSLDRPKLLQSFPLVCFTNIHCHTAFTFTYCQR